MLEPLLQLRGEWRQSAAVSVPASAGEIAELLDKAIDVLDANNQLDEESLLMAADLICKAVVARADVVAMLHMRLVRAAHDYAMVAAVENAEDRGSGSGSAFDSEEALAAALFAGADFSGGVEAPLERAVDPSKLRIDSKALQRSLSNRVPWWRSRWFRFIRNALLLAALAGALFYVYRNPPQLFSSNVVIVTEPGGPSASRAAITPGPLAAANIRSGSFTPHSATCASGQSSAGGDACLWPLGITSAGTISVEVRWDAAAPLTVSLVDPAGKDVGTRATGASGVVTLNAAVAAGDYRLMVTNASATTDPIHFTAKIGSG